MIPVASCLSSSPTDLIGRENVSLDMKSQRKMDKKPKGTLTVSVTFDTLKAFVQSRPQQINTQII